MASTVKTPAPASETRIGKGVEPIRAGQGNSFLLRRLHSLSGIVPVGAFLVEHYISNAFATNGPVAYSDQVKFLSGLPFRLWLEVFGIYLPLLFHGLYGVYIWWRGNSNVSSYPWTGNWMYTLQRWTGIIAFAYIFYHTYEMRFSGIDLVHNNDAAFFKVQQALREPLNLAGYAIGVLASSWHFGYGLFLFCAKWGIVTGERARKRMQWVGVAVSLLFVVIGLASIKAFIRPNPQWQQLDVQQFETSTPPKLDHTKK